jgi:tripeptide aminopeptidase
MNKRRLLQRFLRYVKIDTTAASDVERYPSSPGQNRLGRLLVRELQAAGVADARQDSFGIVLGTIGPTAAGHPPVIAWCAHLDTSPETTGKGVKPQVIRKYAGGDIALPGDPQRVIRTAENPELQELIGRTLVTSDGTTLLGADDKAGVAIIMEAAAWLGEHPEIPHGPIRLCFTCDEEIGRGVDHLDLGEIGAAACYTLDGHATDMIDVETFSADLAEITIRGVNIHPSIAKGRMTNALKVAADLLSRLPQDNLSPETTEDRQGFLHPYEIGGGVGEVQMHVILRDFHTAKLAEQAELLRRVADESMRRFPAAQISVEIKEQYRNMADGLSREPRAVAYAREALEKLGRQAKLTIIRGGTDGSRLTELGLPTPNLSCGSHAPHSPLEWACLDEMLQSVEWLVALAGRWAAG